VHPGMPLGRKHLRRNRDAPNSVGLAFKDLPLFSHLGRGCQMGNQPLAWEVQPSNFARYTIPQIGLV
jgi:hypothetical protein